MPLKRLVIDDVRSPNFDAEVCRSTRDALELVRDGSWDEVWLDHDMDFVAGPDVSWMTDRLEEDAEMHGRIYPVGKFILHSANTYGRKKMRAALEPHYEVIELEEYPDNTVSLVGGGVIEMHADRRQWSNESYRNSGYADWWLSHFGQVAMKDESGV